MRSTWLIPAAVILLITPALLVFPDERVTAPDFQAQFELPQDPDIALKEVLERSEFREKPEVPLLTSLREWLNEAIKRLLIWLLERSPRPRAIKGPPDRAIAVVKIVLVALAAAVFVALAIWFAYLFRGMSFRSRWGSVPEPETIAAGNDARGLWAEATRRAESGEYAFALILLFRSVLAQLDERGDLVLLPERTNREILEQVRSEGHLRRILGDMVRSFNRVRYGRGDCSRAEYEDFLSLCRRATRVT
ncbi:MAG: DUF4129 domain-containing protein [Deltaproteobacteria bacterium]|nr:DUF4129 domain-containing protein [Deltaproteobacteria bacterium]